MKIYDISRPLRPSTAVWPGDQEVKLFWNARLGEQDSVVNLGALQMSLHAGSHADAPLHYTADGAPIEKTPLLQFIGQSILIKIPSHVRHITRDFLTQHELNGTKRVLFKTSHSDLSASEWEDDFVTIDPEAIDYLADHGVILVGTDAPSVDPFTSKALPAHKALARHGIVNLENLVFAGVPAGDYQLIALPLKVEGVDAAPVRAILIEA